MRKTKKALASLAIAGMVLSMAPMSVFGATTSNRISDADRVGTAIAIAANGWTASDSVIVVPADDANIVDALAAAPLAGQLNAPILVTYKGALDPKVQQKIVDLKAKNVYAVGALSADTVASLKAISGVTVTALQGADRTDTAALVAAKLTNVKGSFVVAYNGTADAMSAASFAAANGYSILVANTDGTLPTAEAAYKGATTYTVGGQVKMDGATAFAGADRYATNDAVVKGLTYNYDKVYVANGESLVDALAGAPLAAQTKSPIVLADATHAATGANDNLTASSQVFALGGVGAVSDSVLAKVAYVAPATLAVQSVSAINASQLKVVFNKAVDATEAVKNSYYLLNGVAVVGTPALQDDGVTVIITLTGALTNGTTYVYQVNPVPSKDNAKETSAIYVTTEKVSDTVAPTVTSVTSSTNANFATSVKVSFSEPVASGILKIDGTSYAVVAGTSTTITGLNIDASKAHTLEYVNLTDYAGSTANVTSYGTLSFNVTKDTTAPVVSSISAYGEKQVLVTFSKKMGASALVAANYAVANESLSSYTASVAALTGDTTGTKYVLTVTTASIFSTTVTSHNVSVAFKSTLLDSLGNAIAPVTLSTTLTKDVVAPTVTGIVAEKDASGNTTDLLVNFSEGLAANPAGVLSSGLTIVDSNGVLVTASGLKANSDAIVAGDKAVKFGFTTPSKMNVKWNVTVPASMVTDQAETANDSAAYTTLVDMSQAATGTFSVTSSSIAGQVITVTYPVAIKGGVVAGSATDPVNYSINGVALTSGTSITLNTARTVATITLSAGTIATSDPSAVFRIANVQDLNGNVVTPYLNALGVTDNTKSVLNVATLNADNSISAGFSETVTGLAKTDLVVKVNGSAVTLTPVGVTLAAGTGADAGKWVLNLNALIVNDGTQSFLDMNGNGSYEAGVDILFATEGALTPVKLSTSPIITSVTIGIVPTGTTPTGADAAGNKVANDTVITVK